MKKGLSRLGQAALEFTATYAWALIVLVIVFSGMTYLGVFNTDRYVQTTCSLDGTFTCSNFHMTMLDQEEYVLDLHLVNNLDERAEITSVRFQANDGSAYCMSSQTTTLFDINKTFSLAPKGGHDDIRFVFYDGINCSFVASKLDDSLEKKTKYDLEVFYIAGSGTKQQVSTGTLVGLAHFNDSSSINISNTTPNCSDSDGGQVYDVYGTTVDTITHVDICNGDTLTEWYCDADNHTNSVLHDCAGSTVCSDGACITAPISCSDSDGGKNYSVQGTTEDFYGGEKDVCLDSYRLQEYYCLIDSSVKDFETVICPYGCNQTNGKCNAAVQTCSDSDGGLVYEVYGTVNINSSNYASDSCTGDVLTEWICNASTPMNQTYNCSSVGETCVAGACVNASENLIAYYHFDENSGVDTLDTSSNGFNGKLYGPTWTSDAVSGYALSFDGTNDYVDIGTFSVGTNEITLVAWVKPESPLATSPRIISKSSGVSYQDFALDFYNVSSSTGKFQFRLSVDEDPTELANKQSTAVDVSQWYHVVGTYDGSYMRLYVDGQLKNSIAKTGMPVNTNNPVWIGGNSPGETDRPWKGIIDEVRIYDYALNATEVANLANEYDPNTVCVDGDSGLDYMNGSNVTYGASVYYDECTSNILSEQICTGTSPHIPDTDTFNCTSLGAGYTCDVNKCIYTDPNNCSDSDGGKVYNLTGTTKNGTAQESDSCLNSNKLIEWYCANNSVEKENIICTDKGFSGGCSNGACQEAACPAETTLINGECWMIGAANYTCDYVCSKSGLSCVSGDWDDDASCTVCQTLGLFSSAPSCNSASYSYLPGKASNNCYYRGSAVHQDCGSSSSNVERLCVCK